MWGSEPRNEYSAPQSLSQRATHTSVSKDTSCELPWGSTLNSYFWDEWDLGLYWTVEMDLALVLVLMLVLMLVLVSVWVLK